MNFSLPMHWEMLKYTHIYVLKYHFSFFKQKITFQIKERNEEVMIAGILL